MLAAALLAEVAAYVDAHADLVDADGHRLVVRNGHHQKREVGRAAVALRQPRMIDRRVHDSPSERMRLSSAMLPAPARKSPQVPEVLGVAVPARAEQRRTPRRA